LIPSSSFQIYDTSNGKNSTEGSTDFFTHFPDIFYRKFSTLYILDIMNAWVGSTFWTKNNEQGFATISINPNHNNYTSCSLYTWTLLSLAYHDYEFDYCIKPQSCGNCYGSGKNSSICYPNDNAKEIAAKSSLGVNDDLVFNSPDNNSGNLITKNSKEYIPLYVTIGVMALIILILIIFHGHFRRKTYHRIKKPEEENNVDNLNIERNNVDNLNIERNNYQNRSFDRDRNRVLDNYQNMNNFENIRGDVKQHSVIPPDKTLEFIDQEL